MYFIALFTTLLVGTYAQDPILPNNNWLHYLGKKSSLLDTLITPFFPKIDLNQFEILSRRNLLSTDETILQWVINTLGKRDIILDPLITNIDWSKLQPLLLSKKHEDPLLNPFLLNPIPIGKKKRQAAITPVGENLLGNTLYDTLINLIASKKDLESITAPLWPKILNDPLHNPLLDLLASKKDLSSIVAPLWPNILNDPLNLGLIASKKDLSSIVAPLWPNILNDPLNLGLIASKRDFTSLISPFFAQGFNGSTHIPLIDLIASKRDLTSIVVPLRPNILNDSILLDFIASKRNLESIIAPLWPNIVKDPLQLGLIASKKDLESIIYPLWSNILIDPLHNPLLDLLASKRNLESIIAPVDLGIIPFNTYLPLILSKKRNAIFDPLITNPLIISKKRSIWNPLIDILLPPIKDTVL